MINTQEHAVRVQSRRRAAGLKGRSKAVRRWFKRSYGRGVEAHAPSALPVGLADALEGNFAGCRPFDEVHK